MLRYMVVTVFEDFDVNHAWFLELKDAIKWGKQGLKSGAVRYFVYNIDMVYRREIDSKHFDESSARKEVPLTKFET